MTYIEHLWGDFELPLTDALHYADGHSYGVALDSATPRGFTALPLFDLKKMMDGDPSGVSSVDGLTAVDLGEKGLLWGGEGSYGSEGFIARLTADRALMWAMFFLESNPFDRIRLSGNIAAFSSTSGHKVVVDIDDPRTPISGTESARTT
ncbi:hypothetical protein ACFQ61_01310 [Streptomyces sp. NPDC056500]|uniref:hypothetical protein n=1 Tax=Streptomyces sp. NPDC056500 TaxID=3345840 RepID=UPI0036A8F14E